MDYSDYSDFFESLLGLGLVGIGFFILIASIFVAILIGYVLNSLVLMRVFKMIGYEKPAYAWIPFYNSYILADQISDGLKNIHVLFVDIPADVYKWLWLIVMLFCSAVSNLVPYVGPIISVAVNVIFYSDLYARVFAIFSGNEVEDETALGVASAFVRLIYIIRVLLHTIDGTERVKFRKTDELAYREVDKNTNDFTK